MLHLMLIEDNPADVLLFRESLKQSPLPADVLIAHDGEQALRMLDELAFTPDFIVLDLNLPKFSGLEMLERFRGRLGCPVVVLTSSFNPRDREKALELGAREFLTKPSTFGETVDLVCSLVVRLANNGGAQTAAQS
jgi:CheY-like chemotaxis protein